MKGKVFAFIPIKIYRGGGQLLFLHQFWRPWLQGGTICQERYQNKECLLKMYKILEERVHLGRFIQEKFIHPLMGIYFWSNWRRCCKLFLYFPKVFYVASSFHAQHLYVSSSFVFFQNLSRKMNTDMVSFLHALL